MSNVTIEAPTVDGGVMPYIVSGDSCKEAVQFITGDDQRPPAKHVRISVRTSSGKMVVVVIPNDVPGEAIVLIDGDKI